jgi:hypothetical protein
MNPLFILAMLMATKQTQLPVISEATLYQPPYEQPVKKKKIFFIAGMDPKDNEK